jgi:hypothetical protein
MSVLLYLADRRGGFERLALADEDAEVERAMPAQLRLAKGASPYDVAKLLGDTIETIETHYGNFVKELRERARRIMESGEGLESGLEARSKFAQRGAKSEHLQ